MVRKIGIVTVIVGLMLNIILSVPAQADDPATGETPTMEEMHHPAAEGTTVCPVSGEPMGKDEGIAYTYEGKEYRFCCPMCLEEFKKDPEKYIEKMKKREEEKEKKD